MRINLTKPSHVIFFIVIIPGLSVLVVYMLNYLLHGLAKEWYFPLIDNLGFVGAYATLFASFNLYFWKLPMFRRFGIVCFPNLHGRWRGEVISSYDNQKRTAFLEIRQTYFGINIDMYCQKSMSTSKMADFVKTDNDQLELHYQYLNEPNESAKKTMNIHYGTARLCYFENKNTLEGSYYNANKHDRGHTGSLKFRLKGMELLKRY